MNNKTPSSSKPFPTKKKTILWFLAGATVIVIIIGIILAVHLATVEQGLLLHYSSGIVARKKDAAKVLFTVNQSMIHDFTIPWDPNVHRMWLDPEIHRHNNNNKEQRPPAMLLLTSYGFNQPNQTKGLAVPRMIRDRLIIKGVVNHPWFHPTFWDDFTENDNNNNNRNQLLLQQQDTRFYVFLDQSTCFENNYPFHRQGRVANRDGDFNRSINRVTKHRLFTHIQNRHAIFDHPLFQLIPPDRIKLVLFDCWCFSGWKDRQYSKGFDQQLERVAGVAISSLMRQMREDIEQGLPPPMPKPTHLTEQQIMDIQNTTTCREEERRDLFFVHVGNFRSGPDNDFHARSAFEPLFDDERVFVVDRNKIQKSNVLQNLTYEEINQRSVFSLAARGDCKFSYRFSEALSAGSIPVVLADEWVLPFRPELVDWNECLLIFPERDAGQKVLDALNNITIQERCTRRQKCYDIYQKYMASDEKMIDAIIQGLERVHLNKYGKDQQRQQQPPQIAKFAGIRCPGDDEAAKKAMCNLK